MIRWCSYCQAFLGEFAPFDSAAVSHGICASCDARLEAGENLIETTAPVRDLTNRIFECAKRGDASAIPALLAETAALNLAPASALVSFLQPALYRAGEAWMNGELSVAEEHRLTQWCDRFLTALPSNPPPTRTLELLIFLAPDNTHSLGPRFAAQLLVARGICAQVIAPDLPLRGIVEEIERLRPRMVGVSCALPASLPAADAVLLELAASVDPKWPRRFMLGGFALRSAGASWVSAAGADVAVSVDDAERLLRA
jgi:methanogenic corrinoid protein MtbC1